MIKIVIVEDHQLFAEGIKNIIDSLENFIVISIENSLESLIPTININTPDIVLTDIRLQNSNGLELIKTLKKDYPLIKVIAVSMFDDHNSVQKILKAGADGFISKISTAIEFETALNLIQSRKIVINKKQELAPINGSINSFLLSKRELEIVNELALGLTNKQIGDKLFISELTVKTHRSNIMFKMKAKNVIQLIEKCRMEGLFEN